MSRNPGSIIILEDHEPTAKQLAANAKSNGLWPRVFHNSRSLHDRLAAWGEEPHPILAIIDLDMRYASEADRWPSSFDCLHVLARDFNDVVVIVYSGALDSDARRTAVWKAHPKALLHDKGNISELQLRLDGLLTKEVSDFKIYHGLVMHIPSNETFPHEVGARILLAYPGVVHVHGSAEARAAQRFRRWVETHDPKMTVQNQLRHSYRLTESPEVS